MGESRWGEVHKLETSWFLLDLPHIFPGWDSEDPTMEAWLDVRQDLREMENDR